MYASARKLELPVNPTLKQHDLSKLYNNRTIIHHGFYAVRYKTIKCIEFPEYN